MKKKKDRHIIRKIKYYGKDILSSKNMQDTKHIPHHGQISVYEHCISVTYVSLLICQTLHLRIDEKSLIRGALLHDYYLYDWHVAEHWHRFHGFRHPGFALKNAMEEYELNMIEQNIIRRHMFPLTLIPPCCLESFIVCAADKMCAVYEIFRL